MENNENFVAEEVTENVEQTTEQTPKYTEADFNAKLDEVLGKKIARREAKIRKEYERKYGDLEEVLKAGTGKESVEEITGTFRDFYTKKGVQFAQKPTYSDRDIEYLAQKDADDIIHSGYDEVVEEVDRLADIGVQNMTPREKVLFKTLAEYRQNTERVNELTQMGVTEDVYNSEEFKEFAKQFNATTPISNIYNIYAKQKPKKEITTMGSMKQGPVTGVKDYYTPAEIEKLSMDDLKNPAVWDAVRKSMTGG
jgi:hypothetical protein